MIAESSLKFSLKLFTACGAVFNDFVLFIVIQNRDARGRHARCLLVCLKVNEVSAFRGNRTIMFFTSQYDTQWDVTAANAFPHCQNVGLQTEVRGREELSGTARTAKYFVDDRQHAVLLANFLNFVEVA